MTTETNTVCQGCGYAWPDHYINPARGRHLLLAHGGYWHRCPVVGRDIDEHTPDSPSPPYRPNPADRGDGP